MLKRQFLENKTTRSLDNKLLEDTILKLDLCVNKCRYRSVPRFVKCYNMPLGLGYFYIIFYIHFTSYISFIIELVQINSFSLCSNGRSHDRTYDIIGLEGSRVVQSNNVRIYIYNMSFLWYMYGRLVVIIYTLGQNMQHKTQTIMYQYIQSLM